MSGDTFPKFQAALAEAEEQLQWGLDPDALDEAAARLEALDPRSQVAAQLKQKARRARKARRPPVLPNSVVFVSSSPPVEEPSPPESETRDKSDQGDASP